MYRSKGKRVLDILLAAMGLISSLPFFIFLPPLLWMHFSGNPFFVQHRPGLNGRLFTIVKFRTMHAEDCPLSWSGKMLRKSSLDELPQFWNVLRGDMSIVGPRPLLAEYLPLYSPEQFQRHAVKPGMTGLAQINGRNSLSWEEKFNYDLEYINNVSLHLDVQIICLTARKMLRFRKTNSRDIEVVARFKGNAVC
ncbi:sugar transferase [Dyadobacter sp. CY261]|uniref:sugar transferase n=1 Tax=Dyadobacter sp. CY261 TaxID=2907203 RepID=UPI001F1F44DF|nr:sugar transferase [Dyadobacter sp. CY261]MCF0071654.1 sugar transferase [Dyadobacter sp. CY261]